MFFKKASLHNHANDNTLPAFATDTDDLIKMPMDKSQKTMDWMETKSNDSYSKNVSSHAYFEKEECLRNKWFQINNTEIMPQPSVELPGVTIAIKLKFD